MQKDSGVCGVGVAHNVKIGGNACILIAAILQLIRNIHFKLPKFIRTTSLGIRVSVDVSSDIIESSALGYQNHYISIYSCSWGPNDAGYTVDGPGQLLEATLENGVSTVIASYILLSISFYTTYNLCYQGS